MAQESKNFFQARLHEFKVACHRARRLLAWQRQPHAFPSARLESALDYSHRLYSKSIPIRRQDLDAHPLLEEGKVMNVKLAAPCFDAVTLEPGRPLSFWRALGRVSAGRGFRHGVELRAGCIVPALGGGLCLVSNALFEMALRLDWRILERHGHTMEALPTEDPLWGVDATVFWPYVDLRVEPPAAVMIRMSVAEDMLRLEAFGQQPWLGRVELESRGDTTEGTIRSNQIWRRSFLPDGSLRAHEMVAENRKHLLHPGRQRRRNCLTCAQAGCKARVTL